MDRNSKSYFLSWAQPLTGNFPEEGGFGLNLNVTEPISSILEVQTPHS